MKRVATIITILSQIFIIHLLINLNTYSQIQTNTYTSDIEENTITFGVDKILNTFLFKANAKIFLQTDFGDFSINQNYKGSALKTLQTAFRDDETFNLEYSFPLNNKLYFIFGNNWIYSNDSRSIGINEMQRLNAAFGIRYLFINQAFFELKTGIEKNNQLGVNSIGPVINIKGILPQTNLLDLDLGAKLKGEFVRLEDRRTNLDLDADLNIQKKYGFDDFINANVSYKMLNRDFLSQTAQNNFDYISERRFENRIAANANLGFSFSQNIKSQIDLFFSNLNVLRAYMQSVENIPFSKVSRSLNEMQISSTGQIIFQFDKFNQILGITYYLRNEENTIHKKFDITPEEEQMLKQLENQRDNISNRSRFFIKSLWNPSKKDTFNLEYSASLLQYNTPSYLNNDDRDEFNTILNGTYHHRFSQYLSASFLGELQMTHLVFLKSQRSSLNNWNRVFRINASIQYNLGFLKMNPQFELLANYTVYDFEDISPSIKSFSFRQISYKDSIFILINNNLKIQSKLLFRYFERGVLNWREFKEAPQNSNYEHFINCLLVWNNDNLFECASGIRWFNLSQINLSSFVTQSNSNTNQYSIGPETYVKIFFSNKTNISFVGWFEFQYINNNFIRGVPNFFLMTQVKI